MNLKTIGTLAIAVLTLAAQANAACNDLSKIEAAVPRGFLRSQHAQAIRGSAAYQSTTRTGKDKYTVDVTVQEECMTGAIVYTKAGTCEVVNVIGLPLTDGACG